MPYSVKKHPGCPRNKPWAVVKDSDGSTIGCHPSRSAANRQQRALYANEGKNMPKDEELLEAVRFLSEDDLLQAAAQKKAVQEEVEEKCYDEPIWRPFGGATSFSEADEIEKANEIMRYQSDLNYKLRNIMNNVLADEDIEDKQAALINLINEYSDLAKEPPPTRKSVLDHIKGAIFGDGDDENVYDLKAAMKRENGLDFPARDYAYVPDPMRPTTWQLRLTESPGKVSPTFLARAAAALSPAGFRGVKAKIPPAVASSVKRRIRAEYRKIGVAESEIPAHLKSLPEDESGSNSPLYIWKDAATGEYRFIAIYSNNLRDDDHPAEILSEKAHHAFVEALEKGIFDYPELWHWHIEGTRWGKAEHIMVVDGFPVALGKIDKGHEAEAEAIMKAPAEYPIAMSHGMPRKYIVRNKQDPTIIEFYVSTEISTLPKQAAANKWTSFSILEDHRNKETTMPLTEAQREFLKRVNVTDDAIAGLDGLDEIGKAAGRERKDITEPEAQSPETAEKKTDDLVTKQEFIEAISAVVGPLTEAIKAQNSLIVQQGEAISTLQAEVNEAKSSAKNQLAAAVELTPSASLADMTRASIFGDKSAARVTDADPLKDKKPEETVDEKSGHTGISFLDTLIERTYNGAAGG